MTELPVTVTRRRTANTNHNLNSGSVGDVDSGGDGQFKGHDKDHLNSSFASFSSLSASLWNTAQQSISKSSSAVSFLGQKSVEANNCSVPFVTDFSEVAMPSRDRTSEFRTTVKSYQMKTRGNGYIPREPEKNHMVQQSVQFAHLAKRIGHDLSLTCAKMEKLAELAKKRSLFDDRMAEVEELSQVVKQDITSLNQQIALLQDFSKKNNSGKKNQSQGHSQLVVVGLQSKLAGVSKDFQSVLELRTVNLKQQKSRREMFSQSQSVVSSLPPSVSTGNFGSVLLQDDAASSSVSVDMDHLEQHRMEQISLLNERDTYLQARSSTMENIESSISELGQIFRQLASLVTEQGEMITRIDSNVEETSVHVDMAHTEIVKYFHTISQNRWLMIKVFGVLIFFVIVFIIFLT